MAMPGQPVAPGNSARRAFARPCPGSTPLDLSDEQRDSGKSPRAGRIPANAGDRACRTEIGPAATRSLFISPLQAVIRCLSGPPVTWNSPSFCSASPADAVAADEGRRVGPDPTAVQPSHED